MVSEETWNAMSRWRQICGFWGDVECHEQMEANVWFMGRVRGMSSADGWMSGMVLREALES